MPHFHKSEGSQGIERVESRARHRLMRGMKKDLKNLFKSFSIELPVYSVVVVIYFFLVLHFLGDRLYHMFLTARPWYALLSLLLIIAQGVVLESLTRTLLRVIRRNRED